MKPHDPLEAMLKQLRYQRTAEQRDRTLARAFEAMDGLHEAKPTRPKRWHLLAVNRLSKLAAAAVVLAALLAIFLFVNPLDGTATAYAKVTQAVRSVPWMHIQYTGYLLDAEGNRTSEEGDLDTEIWYSFDAQVVIQRYAGNHITYRDYRKQEIHTYNPEANRVVISALSEKEMPPAVDSPWTWMERNIERMTPFGGDVTRRIGQYQGQNVEIFDIVSVPHSGVAATQGTIFVDTATSLPIAEERTYINTKNGKPQRIESGTFDYPEQGPVDIYALGLSAETPTINSLPLPPWSQVRSLYQFYRRTPPAEKYIAMVISKLVIRDHPVESVDILYADGPRCRQERHLLFQRGSVSRQWQEQKDEFGDTFTSILAWAQGFKAHGQISVSIFNKDRIWHFRRDNIGLWSRREQRLDGRAWTAEDAWHLGLVSEEAWPDIRYAADIIQDDYAQDNGLIRVESQNGVFYLDPERDYIYQRSVDTRGRIEEATEFAQTDTGRWYPRRIESRTNILVMVLETNPEFPPDIFDPNAMPKANLEQ